MTGKVDLDDVISYLGNVVGFYDERVLLLKELKTKTFASNTPDVSTPVVHCVRVENSVPYGLTTDQWRTSYDRDVYGEDIIQWYNDNKLYGDSIRPKTGGGHEMWNHSAGVPRRSVKSEVEYDKLVKQIRLRITTDVSFASDRIEIFSIYCGLA